MRLYYTGAQAYQAAQNKPPQALGGYPSTSLVANDALEAVFAALSPYARQQGLAQVRCLALLNETPAPVSGLRITLEEHPELLALLSAGGPSPDLVLEMGLALPNFDQNANPYFEQVSDGTASPSYTEFGADVQLGAPLAPGQYVGVWLRLRPAVPSLQLPPLGPPEVAAFAPAPYLPHRLRFTWS